MSEAKIITQYIHPPVPDRRFDWCAYRDGDEQGFYGWGKTEEDAILDLRLTEAL